MPSYLEQYRIQEEDPKRLLQELIQVHGFTRDDLAENRGGHISAKQKRQMWIAAFRPAFEATVVFLLWTFVLVVKDQVLPGSWRGALDRAWPFFLLITLATCGAFLHHFAKSGRLVARVWRDLRDGEVEWLRGRVSTHYAREAVAGVGSIFGMMNDLYYYWAGDVKLEVNQEAYEYLVKKYDSQDVPFFLIYFTPRSRLFLSMEPAASLPRPVGATARRAAAAGAGRG